MKRIFGYNDGNNDLVIKKHKYLFYLYLNDTKIARADDIKVLRGYIDGFEKGIELGSDKWFKKYMDLKKSIKE